MSRRDRDGAPTADWRAATRIAAPVFDRTALIAVERRQGDGAGRVLELHLRAPPPPRYNAAPIRQLFGLDRGHHCFAAEPHYWAKFHEPQITAGFAYYLDDGGWDRRLMRALALHHAACGCAGGRFPKLSAEQVVEAEVIAEEPTSPAKSGPRAGRGRIDLIVDFTLEDGARIGTALEAKFDHTLTPGQLFKYTQHLRDKRQWVDARSPLLLVGRRTTPLKDGARWHTTNWRRFMTLFERELDAAADDDGFRRFRRTLWETAYA